MESGQNGLALVDWLIIASYAMGTLGLGYYYSRRQESTDEYFTGGGRMNSTLIGFSLFATLLSTISYLSTPGESIAKGPTGMVTMFAIPVIYVVVGYGLIPLYMRRRVTSTYELLEERLGIGIRLLGSTLFIVLRLVWMSLLIYLSGQAMAVILGVGDEWIPLIVFVTGFVAVVYTSLGGLRAVVITDFVQTVLMMMGALLVILMVTIDLGGFSWFPTAWQPNWDHQPLFSFDPGVRISVIGLILYSTIWFICTCGGDQTVVQRYMATADAAAARRALRTHLLVGAVLGTTLSIVGFALLGYFRVHGDLLPEGISITSNADKIFPHFISFHLPVGISGLVVSAMFAAAMSSVDSGVNSICAVVTSDFLDRFGRQPKTEKAHVRLARWLAFGIGTIVVVGSSFMEQIPGNITAVTAKTTNLLVTPIFCLFFFALFVPFARPIGVVVGTLCGIVTAVLIAFSGPIFGMNPETGLDPISFMWISPVALSVNIAVGCLVSLAIGKAQANGGRE
jgi:SSS family solute:Na+ symporter